MARKFANCPRYAARRTVASAAAAAPAVHRELIQSVHDSSQAVDISDVETTY